MEQPDDDFLIFFLLNMCAPRIMALLVPVYFILYENFLLVPIHFMFIRELLTEGFVLKKHFSSYSFVEAALTMKFCGI